VDKIGKIAETLVAHGKAPETPVALVQEGTTAAQRRVDATLGTVAEAVRVQDVRPPAVIVVGDVVNVGPDAVTAGHPEKSGTPETFE
jgi:uroporphyrin-III C-methyltransferase/precorrin-2 dehydrogenase/sirohydrochlorin ferrochelatase